MGVWTASEDLPLHLCSLGMLLSAWAIVTKRQLVFEVAYYWVFVGEWPWHILWFEAVGFLFFVLLYVTMWWVNRRNAEALEPDARDRLSRLGGSTG
jgi:uncharacterized membrane protein YwaF